MTCADGICGTGGWTGPLPGDPDNNVVLSAVTTLGGVDVSWTYPGTNPFAVAHTLLYRGISASFAAALPLATVGGAYHYDKVDTDVPITYYYWIKLVSVHGTVGAVVGPASALARPTNARILELLTGKIDNSILGQALKTKLADIGTLNTNLLNEIKDRETGQTSLAQALVAVDTGLAQAMTFLNSEVTSRIAAGSAQITATNLVASTLGSNIAAVTTNMTTNINAVKGTVNALYTAKVTVNGLVGGFGLSNNGAQVDAGFDVDTFWVGRTSTNKRKPFIISGDTVYLDKARIRDADIDTLKVAGAAITVPVSSGHGLFTGNGAYQTIAAATLPLDVAAPIQVIFACVQGFSTTTPLTRFRIKFNNALPHLYDSGDNAGINTNPAICVKAAGVVGDNTFVLEWYSATSAVAINQGTLFLTGLKR